MWIFLKDLSGVSFLFGDLVALGIIDWVWLWSWEVCWCYVYLFFFLYCWVWYCCSCYYWFDRMPWFYFFVCRWGWRACFMTFWWHRFFFRFIRMVMRCWDFWDYLVLCWFILMICCFYVHYSQNHMTFFFICSFYFLNVKFCK